MLKEGFEEKIFGKNWKVPKIKSFFSLLIIIFLFFYYKPFWEIFSKFKFLTRVLLFLILLIYLTHYFSYLSPLGVINNNTLNKTNASNKETTKTNVPKLTEKPKTNFVKVVKVIDGDTIELENNIRLRYIGINTPETFNKSDCFGIESFKKNKELVEGKFVYIKKDISETDKYGRLLRYVYLQDGTFVNELLVKEGYAYATSYPPDIEHQKLFIKAQQYAKKNKLGLWSSCFKNILKVFSYSNIKSTSCIIKGNISYKTKQKIYHTPNCPYYNKTKINTLKGERWFCSEGEAVQAGWAKAKNCP